ncbi:MAG TPA: hypothetical protein VLH58_07640 [Candidatus Methylomirabilis sp.]|nr:hypothetical protein [Candidatus Methylomirabilis sp.]
MGTVYATIVAVILVFPWSLVALTLAGALMERRKVRVRAPRESGSHRGHSAGRPR